MLFSRFSCAEWLIGAFQLSLNDEVREIMRDLYVENPDVGNLENGSPSPKNGSGPPNCYRKPTAKIK